MKRHQCNDLATCKGCGICGQLTGPLFECEGCGQVVCDEEASVQRGDAWIDLDTLDDLASVQADEPVWCWDCVTPNWRQTSLLTKEQHA